MSLNAKDIIKISLISYGFDRDLSVTYYKKDDRTYLYEVSATNKDGIKYSNTDQFMPVLVDINAFMRTIEPTPTCDSRLLDIMIKDLLNTSTRMKILNDLNPDIYRNNIERLKLKKKLHDDKIRLEEESRKKATEFDRKFNFA